MPYARARRFYLTPPSVWIFFISVVLAILAVLVTYGHVRLFGSSYAFLVLLIGYILLAILALLVMYGYVSAIRASSAFLVLMIGYIVLVIGCLFRRV